MKKGSSGFFIRLLRTVLIVISIAFFLVFCIVAVDTYSSYSRMEVQNQQTQMIQVAEQINTVQNTIQSIGDLIIYNTVVQNQIDSATEEDATVVDSLVAIRKIESTLREYLHVVDGTVNILLYANNGETYTTRYVRASYDLDASRWYQEYKNRNVRNGFSIVHKSIPMQSGAQTMVISYLSDYYSIDNYNEKLGQLCIDVDFTTFSKAIQPDNDELVKGVCLLDANGKPLFQNGTFDFALKDVLAESENGVFAKDGKYCVVAKDMQDGWVLVSQINQKVLLKEAMRPVVKSLLIFILTWLAMTVILRITLKHFLEPIQELGKASDKVARGDFTTRVDIHTGDEIEDLANTFNKMVVSVNDLMEQSVKHEKEIEKMKTENLLLQINPHFIYNTLNSIVYMARMNGSPNIANFTNAFITLLQNTLRVRDSVFNNLDAELKNVQNYLYLQEYRYGNKFTYEIICPDILRNCQVLNVMLQPVVENAIFHGIAPKDGPGHISIHVEHILGSLQITVADDGIGMRRETVEEIMRADYTQKSGVHKIGLGNVRKRIQDIYGTPYTLNVESEEGKGTIITMILPYRLLQADKTEE